MNENIAPDTGKVSKRKRKRGTRTFFKRTKNDERKRQEQRRQPVSAASKLTSDLLSRVPLQELNIERSCVGSNERCHPHAEFESLKQSVQTFQSEWHDLSEESCIRYCLFQQPSPGVPTISHCVTVRHDFTWSVAVLGKEVPGTISVFSGIEPHITTLPMWVQLLKQVRSAAICPGNPEDEFVTLCQKKGGEIRGNRGNGDVVAVVENKIITNVDGTPHSATVRRIDCQLLCEIVPGQNPIQRCKSCRAFRSTLRSMKTRSQCRTDYDRTAHSSRANFCHLRDGEKDERMRNLSKAKKAAKLQVSRLQKRVESLIAKQSITLTDDDADDVTQLIKEVSDSVYTQFHKNSAQRVFWEQQHLYNSLKNKKQMRWHPLVIRFALNLKYVSSAAYRAVNSSGFIKLPSERTLADYTHWMTVTNGVQSEFIERFRLTLQKDTKHGQQHSALLMDEMKIRSGLVFKKSTGALVGFVDLGNVNADLEQLVADSNEKHTAQKLADQMLVFMVRAIFKPSLSFPVAHYPSAGLKGQNLYPIVWDVVCALEMYNIPVMSITSDGAKPNRKFYKLCRGDGYKTPNPFADRDVYFFSDVPHLLKTARNCFSNSFAHSNSRNMKVRPTYNIFLCLCMHA